MGTGICTLHSGVHRNWQFLGTEAKEQTRNRDTIPRSGDADRVKGSFAGEGQGRERNWQDAQMWGGSMVRSSLSSPLAGICSSSLPLVPCRQALGECFLSVFSLKNFWSSNLLGLCLFFCFWSIGASWFLSHCRSHVKGVVSRCVYGFRNWCQPNLCKWACFLVLAEFPDFSLVSSEQLMNQALSINFPS